MCFGFNIVYNNKSIIISCQSEHVNISANMMYVCMYVFFCCFFCLDNLIMCFDFKCMQQYKMIFNNLLFLIIDLLFFPHSLKGSLCMKIFSCFYISERGPCNEIFRGPWDQIL